MKRIITPLVITMFAIGCSPAKMSVSEDLKSGAEEYAVKGVNGTRIKQKISFAEFSTNSVKRSWTKGSSSRLGLGYLNASQQEWVNMISVEYFNRKQTIRFNLQDGQHYSDVFCVARFNAEDLEIGRRPNSVLNIGMDILGIGGQSSSTYYVQIFESATADRPWEMMIDNQLSQSKPKEYIGYLAKSKTEYYTIVPVSRIEINGKAGNMLAGSIGFEFRNAQGKAVAAVSTINNGMVFLPHVDKEERFLLANACTALLLQDIIE